jgi:hypothetical protein
MDEQEANAKLVLGTIYILLGMGLISMCINLMQEKIISQVMDVFVLCTVYTVQYCRKCIVKIKKRNISLNKVHKVNADYHRWAPLT